MFAVFRHLRRVSPVEECVEPVAREDAGRLELQKLRRIPRAEDAYSRVKSQFPSTLVNTLDDLIVKFVKFGDPLFNLAMSSIQIHLKFIQISSKIHSNLKVVDK